MKLKEWADKNNISYITAWRWFKQGKMPSNVKAIQTQSKTILVYENDEREKSEKKDIGDISPIEIVESISKCYNPSMRDKIIKDEKILSLVSEIRELIGDKDVDTELNKMWLTIASIQLSLEKLESIVGRDMITSEDFTNCLDMKLEGDVNFENEMEKKKTEFSNKIKEGGKAVDSKGISVGFSRTNNDVD